MQDENDENENENDENENDENVCRPDVYWRKGRQTVPTGEGKFRIVDGGSLQVLILLTSQCLSNSHITYFLPL